MNSLHSIRAGAMTARTWLFPVDMRGHHIGTGGRWTRAGAAHVYEIQRGLPPELGSYERRYWYPWSVSGRVGANTNPSRMAVLNPACGPLKSASRQPSWSETIPPAAWDRLDPRCPRCLELYPDTPYLNEIRDRDPFTALRAPTGNMTATQRAMIVDPITGM